MFVLAQLADLAGGNLLPRLVAVPVVATNYVFFLLASGEYSRIIARICVLFSTAALVGCFFMSDVASFFMALFLMVYCVLVIVVGLCAMAMKGARRVAHPDWVDKQ